MFRGLRAGDGTHQHMFRGLRASDGTHQHMFRGVRAGDGGELPEVGGTYLAYLPERVGTQGSEPLQEVLHQQTATQDRDHA